MISMTEYAIKSYARMMTSFILNKFENFETQRP